MFLNVSLLEKQSGPIMPTNPQVEPKDKARAFYRQIKEVSGPRPVLDRVAFLKECVAGKNVLDIGCVEHSASNMTRSDWMHRHICDASKTCLGMDYDQEEVRKLNERGFNVVAADATHFDIGRKFDVIVAGEVLEHLLDARGFLASIARHLEKNGRLILTVPNANNLNYFLQNLLLGYEADGYDHTAFYTPLTAFNLLRKCGFEITKLVYLQPNTAGHHSSFFVASFIALFRIIQIALCYIRPSMSRAIGIVARVKN